MPASYQDRLRRVQNHIFDHPDGDLSLDALAEVAAMSRFHWHRVFHAMTGETCAQAVRRIRAHRAACWLVQTDWPLERIAARSGYDNVQSFTRLFRAQFGVTPLAFRKDGCPGSPMLNLKEGNVMTNPVEIRDMPPVRLAALAHQGAYYEIGRAYGALSAIMTAQGLWPQVRGTFALYYDSPADVAEADLRSHAGFALAEGVPVPEGSEEVHLPGGRHAVMTYKGPYAGLAAAWDALYATWLPGSGEEPADAPPFEKYLNDPSSTPPQDLLTEICVPLKPAG